MMTGKITAWVIAGILLIGILGFFFIKNVGAENSSADPSYQIETIDMPEGLNAEVGGIGFMPDGRLVACFHRGEVMTYDPERKVWKMFAEGLHDPLGLLVLGDDDVLVMQQPELTRLRDTDGDGVADHYQTVTDDFGISGNYHEFNYGPVKDEQGNLYIALNTGSSGDGIHSEVRGALNTMGRDGEKGNRQMFSVVPYRGWVLKLTPQGEVIPFASGLRSPNGIGFDESGNLFVADNQGDWVSTSALYKIEEGKFYGHPASLVWTNDWNRQNPFYMPIKELNDIRTRAVVLFPQGIMANSPAQILCDTTDGKFGPFAGQLLIGEMNHERIVRVMLENVGGSLQGACVPFIDGNGLRMGNNRLAFAPDGSLWVGQTDHGWAGAEGLQRIVFTGNTPMDIHTMSLTEEGFDLTFTEPAEQEVASDPANYNFSHYYYDYYKKDATEPVDKSIQVDLQTVPVKKVSVSQDGKKVSITLGKMKAGYIYELKLDNITSDDGKPLANKLICYTLNELRHNIARGVRDR